MLGPVSDASADAILSRIPEPGPARVLDVGCGKGALLVRALERWGGTGVGIEPNPTFAADARALAEQRLGPGRVRIIEAEFAQEVVDGETFPLVICTGALHAFGDGGATPEGILQLMALGGHVLVGPGYWRRWPAREYLATTGIPFGEFEKLPDLLAKIEAESWRCVAVHESTPAEWDDYEESYATRVRTWCDANPVDPDAAPFRDRITRWADAYTRWGRDTMGYALLLLTRAER
jgi:SAM-dependent methyltransferase